MSIAKRLQWLIDRNKISQADVARGAGIDTSKVSKLITGETKRPRRTTIVKIADFFSCDIDWLATGEGEPFSIRHQCPPSSATNSKDQAQASGQLEETLAQLRRVQFKQACPGYLSELMDFIGDKFGEDEAAVRHFMTEVMESRGDYKSWKREREARATQTPKTGTLG